MLEYVLSTIKYTNINSFNFHNICIRQYFLLVKIEELKQINLSLWSGDKWEVWDPGSLAQKSVLLNITPRQKQKLVHQRLYLPQYIPHLLYFVIHYLYIHYRNNFSLGIEFYNVHTFRCKHRKIRPRLVGVFTIP